MKTVTFPIAAKGLGTEFTQASQPIDYAQVLENRFINLHGAAEKRGGLKSITSPTTSGRFDCKAEHINPDGSSTFLASKISTDGTTRELYKLVSGTWTNIGNLDIDTKNGGFSERCYAKQMGDKTIFNAKDMRTAYYNGYDGNIYYLLPKVISGQQSNGASTALTDSDVSDWINGTFVSPLDIVWNVTKNAYGVVTSVGTTALDMTFIGSAGNGLGYGAQPTIGDYYVIIDAVSNNIIRPSNASQFTDNIAVAGNGTGGTVVAVSGVNFATTDIRRGDFLYNTTKALLQGVEAVPANLVVTSAVTSSGDTYVFLKPAISYAASTHVHYGRFYAVDERDRTKVIESGPDDPEDYTTFKRTIKSGIVNYGAKQPEGEEIIGLSTFQNYLVAAGRKNVYLSTTTDPSTDATAASTILTPVGLFSQGALGSLPLANIGRTMVYASHDGLRQFTLSDVLAVQTDNVSEVIKSELRSAIRLETDETKIQAIHYPARNWVMFKVGEVIYNYNYSNIYYQGQMLQGGSWSKFTGKLAECDVFLLRQDGILEASRYDTSADATTFYEFDTGSYTDDSSEIVTRYGTSWLTLSEAGGVVCDGRYIKPYFENTSDTAYTIRATADLQRKLNSYTITASAAGSGAAIGSAVVGSNNKVGAGRAANEGKYPLRWRGEQFRIDIESSASRGEDIISKFTIYGNTYGLE